MAILKGENIDFKLEYFQLNQYNELEYKFDLLLNNKSLFNNEIINHDLYDDGFIFDILEEDDKVTDVFIDVCKKKVGGGFGKYDSVDFFLNIDTWNELKVKQEKHWKEDSTPVIVKDNEEIREENRYDFMQMFVPLFAQQIKITLSIDMHYFIDNDKGTYLEFVIETTHNNLVEFTENLLKEKEVFLPKYYAQKKNFMKENFTD